MIAYVLPTHNRPQTLHATLEAIGALPSHAAEVIIVDNASAQAPDPPRELANRLPVMLIRRATNEGAAARNAGVRASDPASRWIVMLDDDSRPLNLNFIQSLERQPADVLAVQAEIWLGDNRLTRESGGLPEVFIGCGVAIRRDAFLDAGGYDPAFDYYAEEYDLAARLLLAGGQVAFERSFQVVHDKTTRGRDMNRILRRLVRNNCWVMQRYAPDLVRRREIARTVRRYGRIAIKERAAAGYARGMLDLSTSLRAQPRWPMRPDLWDRFTGKAAAMAALSAARSARRFATAAIVARGKNDHVIEQCLRDLGVRLTHDQQHAEALVIGTLSPGPLLDAWDARTGDPHVVAPWNPTSQSTVPAPAAVPGRAAA